MSEGQLGLALLFVGLGALPSMAFTGRAIERWGLRVAAWAMGALAVMGVLIAWVPRGAVGLSIGMLLVGAASGATDVAVNTLAARAEHSAQRPVISRSHGLFSIGVVSASLVTGAILGVGVPLPGVFALVAVIMFALALAVATWCQGLTTPNAESSPSRTEGEANSGRLLSWPLIAVGLVAALAYAIENAHQSWGALMLTDVFAASPRIAAAAPATFAATAAAARLGLAPWSRHRPTVVLVAGGALATIGTAILATSPDVPVALVGLVLGAFGTATLFPTLLSRSLRTLDPTQHARATSTVATTAYLGFLLGPAYVGLLADHFGIRGALGGVAVLAVIFTLLAAPISGWAAGATRN